MCRVRWPQWMVEPYPNWVGLLNPILQCALCRVTWPQWRTRHSVVPVGPFQPQVSILLQPCRHLTWSNLLFRNREVALLFYYAKMVLSLNGPSKEMWTLRLPKVDDVFSELKVKSANFSRYYTVPKTRHISERKSPGGEIFQWFSETRHHFLGSLGNFPSRGNFPVILGN